MSRLLRTAFVARARPAARLIHTVPDRILTQPLDCDYPTDRRTKIIATVGPSTPIADILDAGMQCMRLNASHGDHAYFEDKISVLNKELCDRRMCEVDFSDGANEQLCAVALDTKGPEIRTGAGFENSKGSVFVEMDSKVVVSTSENDSSNQTSSLIFVDYPNLVKAAQVGAEIFVDDGALRLRVDERLSSTTLRTTALNSHELKPKKGVNLPLFDLHDIPAVTEKDLSDLKWAAESDKIDFVFASFVRKKEHVLELRKALDAHGGERIKLISKIENREGVSNIDEILEASDGIMVARGDLGIEIPIERVYLCQRALIHKAKQSGKVVIVATQMLESMCKSPRPTRAEAVDVANAVVERADAVMLSGETASGLYPVESVRVMSEICRASEILVDHEGARRAAKACTIKPMKTREAIVSAAVSAAQDEFAKCLLMFSETGSTPRLASKYSPDVPILVATTSLSNANQLQLVRGVVCILLDSKFVKAPRDETMAEVHRKAHELGIYATGDKIIEVQTSSRLKDVDLALRLYRSP